MRMSTAALAHVLSKYETSRRMSWSGYTTAMRAILNMARKRDRHLARWLIAARLVENWVHGETFSS